MAVSEKLKQYPDDNNIEYTVLTHPRAYTAQEIAAALHVPGKEMAKTIVVKCGIEYVMIVLPASYKLSFEDMKSFFHTENIEFAPEDTFHLLFPDCEVGAMSPFGNFYHMPVYMAMSLEADKEIAFNAGTHTDSIKMKMDDFMNLTHPTIAKLSKHI